VKVADIHDVTDLVRWSGAAGLHRALATAAARLIIEGAQERPMQEWLAGLLGAAGWTVKAPKGRKAKRKRG